MLYKLKALTTYLSFWQQTNPSRKWNMSLVFLLCSNLSMKITGENVKKISGKQIHKHLKNGFANIYLQDIHLEIIPDYIEILKFSVEKAIKKDIRKTNAPKIL